MFSAWGPDRRARACAPARARPARGRGRGTSAARAGPRRRRASRRAQRRLGDRRARRGRRSRVQPCSRQPLTAPSRTSATTMPPMPTASAFSSTTTRARACQRVAHLVERERAGSDLMPSAPMLDALLAQLVDASSIVPSTEPSATTTSRRPRRGSRARGRRSRGRSARAKSAATSGIRSSACICLACARYLTSVNASGPTIAPIVTGSSGSSTWRGSNGGRKASTCSCVGHVDPLEGVGEDEPVHAHHHRQRQLLGEAERLHVEVERLLVGLGVQLDPAASRAGDIDVAVVVPDVDRRADRAVGDRHHDRQAEARGVVERLDHVEQPLAGGRGVGRARRSPRRRSHTDIAANSDSTLMNSHGRRARRDFTSAESPSTMWVCGEIG